MLIPEHKIDEVLERVDVVAVVSRYVELKKSGRSYKGRCPFHEEKSASFYVTPELRRYKCFGCQAGGDAIAFIQRYLGKSFTDAVRELARDVGVEVDAAADPGAREKRELREATDAAAAFFSRLLWGSEGRARAAREYLSARGVSEDTARAFGLGLSGAGWSELCDHLASQGILEWGLKAGLVQPRARGDGAYDTFRHRLMVPIRAVDGRTIAFGGRLLEGGEGPKYLNSKESRLYNKSSTLYGLDLARDEVRRRKAAVLVEGYFDCIGLHQAGLKNVVALCSTALTPGHLQALKQAEAQELILLLDGDEAGRKAVERLAGSILATGTAAQVALLPEGEDPDTFARREGPEGVSALLARARPLSEHLLATVLPEGRGAAFEAKMRALERLKTVVAQQQVGLIRSAFFSTLARHFGLPAAELEAALRGKSAPLKPWPKERPGPTSAVPQPPKSVDALEALFCAFALKRPALLSVDAFGVRDELSHSGLRNLLASAAAGTAVREALEEAGEAVAAALRGAARNLPRDDAGWEPTFRLICRKLKLRRLDEQLSHIARLARTLVSAHELDEETRRLQEERIALLALKKAVIDDDARDRPGTSRTVSPV